MVGIIGIAARLVLNEGETVRLAEVSELLEASLYLQTARGGARGWDVAADKAAVAMRVSIIVLMDIIQCKIVQFAGRECSRSMGERRKAIGVTRRKRE
jgi:hypothetical protein